MAQKAINTKGRLVSRSRGSKHLPYRRTFSVDDSLQSMMMKVRGEFISNGIDLDSTRALNMFLALGIKKFNERPWNDETEKLVIAYVFNDKLKWESLVDEMQDEFVKSVPKIIKQVSEELAKILVAAKEAASKAAA